MRPRSKRRGSRAPAEVEHKEEEDPEQRRGHHEQRRVRGGKTAVREDPQGDQRILVTALDDDEPTISAAEKTKPEIARPDVEPQQSAFNSVNTSAIVPSVIVTAPRP